MTTRELLIQATYLVASVLFILGLRSLTAPATARRGMQQAAVGMLLAIVGTLLHEQIVDFRFILLGLALGSAIGYPLGMFVPMTAMPQRIAISHMFGALAATLVGISEFYNAGNGGAVGHARMAALGFEVLFGALTVTGSFIAFGKLQELLPGRPLTFKGQNAANGVLFLVTVALFVWLVVEPATPWAFYLMAALAFAVGVSLVVPIGGADMPVVLSLLNSYAGLASSATGFAIGNNVLIIAGALDGASGFILSIAMSKAMNRSFGNVLFGAFGAPVESAKKLAEGLTVHAVTAEDAAIQLAYARKVIVVPGYGMAVAQAQHQVRELADLVEKNGGEVLYAIHPVAGRMPGHMNVLLAEADVPYDKLKDMEEVNHEFQNADVALVIGANDVVNPAAKHDKGSPIYGMPILAVQDAKSIIVMKRSMSPGFAGIENELFYDPKTSMLFGDAKASLARLVTEIKQQA
ncbi:NAD(P)(+) transhydrogenase (Re/Si-specific) subunit beta [Anaeromyxobacter paludicola]|uniref:NAD(P) transhydrogenase subunit beta n=1 Tax=Anaeromyxobacter paludicola TaxID=2918171 RepID=A0ABM7XAD8_9BACT|nr:NAD(P)(+) transhydrogenase (Re/Si-specific) subunit beta [Anaeromyxobacter paludicola]BDG08816.1 NAD(P) transhydrogenase subunit beta [Anaeromyxobacter paludicola]